MGKTVSIKSKTVSLSKKDYADDYRLAGISPNLLGLRGLPIRFNRAAFLFNYAKLLLIWLIILWL